MYDKVIESDEQSLPEDRKKGKLTNSVNGDSGCEPLLDVRDHTVGDLGVARRVEVIVVQVEDSVRISRTSSLEGDGDEVLAQDLGEDGRAQGAVLVEDLVADVLDTHSSVHILPLGAPGFPRATKGN